MQSAREISDSIISGIILALRQAYKKQTTSNITTTHNIPEEEYFVSKPVFVYCEEKPDRQSFQCDYTVYVHAWKHGFLRPAAYTITIIGKVTIATDGSYQPSLDTYATMTKQDAQRNIPDLLIALSHGDGHRPLDLPGPIALTVRPFTVQGGKIIFGKTDPKVLPAPHY